MTTITTEADDLWLVIRSNYATVLRSIPKQSMRDFYTMCFAGPYGGATWVDSNAERIICSLHDNAANAERSVMNNKILASLLAFHDPVVDTYVRTLNKLSIESKMQIGKMRDQTSRILKAYNLSYLTSRM